MLRRRGRRSKSLAQLSWKEFNDPELLRALDSLDDPWVLLTGDDRLPDTHAEAVRRYKPTLATIDTSVPEGLTQEEHRIDVAQRWAHIIAIQDQGSIRRYFPATHRVWTPRRR